MTQLAPGQLLIGKYRIEQSLGEGGMGAVFLAENVDIGRRVAIKVLLPQAAGNPEVVARFRQEARAAAAIGHPGIVDVLDLGRTDEGAEFIVMEHLRGETLGDRLAREGPLPLPVAMEILSRLLDALEAAHRHDIVHRDLKPDNIFLVSEPVPAVKILDFGISKLSGKQHEQVVRTATGAVMGTPLYMAPEQALAEREIGPSTDLYSLGAILYQMLSGKPPFVADNTARLLLMITSENPTPVTTLRGELPGDLGALVMELLRKKPAERPGSATEVKQRLAGMGLASMGDLDAILVPLATADTLAPQAAITGPGDSSLALAETEMPQPKITGPGVDVGDASLTRPTKPWTTQWVVVGLAALALVGYLGYHFSKGPAPMPAMPAMPDRGVPRPDLGVVAPDSRPALDLEPSPDTRSWRRPPRTTKKTAPKTKKTKKSVAKTKKTRQKPDAAPPPPPRIDLPRTDELP